MTDDLAGRIFADFKGRTVEEWTVTNLLGHGGTSVVLLANNGADQVAIKVLAKELTHGTNDELVELEAERIKRQLSLSDHDHPNLVRIRCAGRCPQTGYDYLVMDYVPDPRMDELINDIPREKIWHVIQQVARAALYLHEKRAHVHRDIKPSNIALRLSDCHVTLLDLGVMRPVSGDTASDQGTPRFVGTKRYAPPEFLDGKVKHNSDGWLAVSFYQIGGILHDLIMRQRLFDQYDDDDQLRNAVRTEVPRIDASDVPSDLLQLARDCLQKDPELRRGLASWDRFLGAQAADTGPTELERLRQVVVRIAAPQITMSELYPEGALEAHANSLAMTTMTNAFAFHLRRLLSDNTLFPKSTVEVSPPIDKSVKITASLTYTLISGSSVEITFLLRCTLLDFRSLVCCCEIGFIQGDDTGCPTESFREIYRGSFEGGNFTEALEREVSKGITGILQVHSLVESSSSCSSKEIRE